MTTRFSSTRVSALCRRRAQSRPAAAAPPTFMRNGTRGTSGQPPPCAPAATAAAWRAAPCTRRPTLGPCATMPTCCRRGGRRGRAGAAWVALLGISAAGSLAFQPRAAGLQVGLLQQEMMMHFVATCAPCCQQLKSACPRMPPICPWQEAEWACTPVSAAIELLPPAAGQ